MKKYIVVSYREIEAEVIGGYDNIDDASEFVADFLKDNPMLDPDDYIIYEFSKRAKAS